MFTIGIIEVNGKAAVRSAAQVVLIENFTVDSNTQCVLYIIPNEGQASAHSIGNNVVVGIAVCNCNSGLELHVLTNVGIIFAAQSVGGVLFDLFGD